MFPQTRVNSTERSCHCWKSGSRVLPCPQSVDTPHHIYCPFLDLEYMVRVKCGRVWIGHQSVPHGRDSLVEWWSQRTTGFALVHSKPKTTIQRHSKPYAGPLNARSTTLNASCPISFAA